MDVVFMGTPRFAVPSLEALVSAHRVLGVFTQPDRPSGRGRRPAPPPVKHAAAAAGLPVYQPESLRDPAVTGTLAALRPDVICVAAYGRILPREVLGIPAHGCINVHASLLPRYRGAAPIERAILAGDEVTGVSIMRMEEGLDTGPYASQVPVPIEDLTADELADVLAAAGAEALVATLAAIATGTVSWTPQDESQATYAPKITAEDVALCPDLDVATALRRIRASSRRAPARLRVGDTCMTVAAAQASVTTLPMGSVQAGPGGLVVGFSDGGVELTVVRPAGRASMSGDAWSCGARLDDSAEWTAL
ncbi:MAG: methionyl-tRNA formyltransferase [Anaerosomatales bacterium]|nr:methionyl-tRNA formyltransferase [Anaerosomatales bacterium]